MIWKSSWLLRRFYELFTCAGLIMAGACDATAGGNPSVQARTGALKPPARKASDPAGGLVWSSWHKRLSECESACAPDSCTGRPEMGFWCGISCARDSDCPDGSVCTCPDKDCSGKLSTGVLHLGPPIVYKCEWR